MPVRRNDQDTWVERVLGVSLPKSAADGPARTAWRSARSKAIADMAALESAIKKSTHPEVTEALILLRAIRANLTEAPANVSEVAELQRYLATDDIIASAELPNVFGIKVVLREPLLQALAALGAELETAVA